MGMDSHICCLCPPADRSSRYVSVSLAILSALVSTLCPTVYPSSLAPHSLSLAPRNTLEVNLALFSRCSRAELKLTLSRSSPRAPFCAIISSSPNPSVMHITPSSVPPLFSFAVRARQSKCTSALVRPQGTS